ncbi:phosphoesterase [Methanothermus fervidus DSM 2088]|uniref:Phosphoesterase n=1 Tax=Methanothermus fervidus (strain ATCC 43054 / DSM 2088 / JCM 10308 / V24 S) TaxID=523846 RepID=E3GX22_METFV|nr:metallophosphoesterase [Methanothermus fervidus]ADP76911.1 phosphoesterase [Methanothermus fervidus DSM 2088]
MKILPKVEIVDLSLKIDDYIVIADLHLGYEEYLRNTGMFIPNFQIDLIIDRIERIRKITKSKKLIINGDLKHEFGKLSFQESTELENFLKYAKDKFKKIVLVKGNHDPLLPYLNIDLKIVDSIKIKDYLIVHGHEIPEKLAPNIIIGHEHPCIGLRHGGRVEKVKCFLKCKFKNRNLIVMPSFNFVTEGSDILQSNFLSPFLKKIDVDECNVYVVEDFEVFEFGKVKDIIKLQADEL